jgi:dTDP-4-amino-4,6-dideoxygalactose transaminase
MLGIGAGDEVIIPAHNWISAAEMTALAGAKPVFVDSDETFTIDPTKVKEKITARTKAIIPVHLYGQPAKVNEIRLICEKFNLHLIEDCAQAILAEENGKCVGTSGIAAAFSFYPSKNLGAYGDGGAILTNDDALEKKLRSYANHGMIEKNVHAMEGVNSRLDSLQAVMLLVKLKHIRSWNEKRNEHARLYSSLLGDLSAVELPPIRKNAKHAFHLYVIRTETRDALQKHLAANGIQTAIHYPLALPFMAPYQSSNHEPEDFPVAYRDQQRILSLPLYPELTDEQIIFVCDSIKTFFNKQ